MAQAKKNGPVSLLSIVWARTTWTKDMLEGKEKEFKDALDANCEDYIFQAEQCPTTATFHFQAWAKIADKKRPEQVAKELGIGGCEVSPASNAGKAALKNYCMKAASQVRPPIVKNPARVAKEQKDEEAKKKKEAAAYKGQDLPEKLCQWQENLRQAVVDTIPHSRQIIWIADPKGCGGKTKFGKYMAYNHEACTLAWGDSKDILNLVCRIEETRGAPKIFIFNLTRSKPKLFASDDLYSSLEAIKDGMIVNTKYEPRSILFDVPHVIVLANCYPELEKMSADRWKVIRLKPEDGVPASFLKPEVNYQLTFGDPWVPEPKNKKAL